MNRAICCVVGVLGLSLWGMGAADAQPSSIHGRPIKVFILAGQSNMEGKAKISLLDYQASQPKYASLYKHLRTDDQWRKRDDVWIRFHEQHGPLTVGYGSPNCIGPELEFGYVVGDRYEEPVLLIKTAWGGRSLYQDFRPPSAGMPPADVLQKMVDQRNKNKPDSVTLDDVKQTFGKAYRDMFDEIQSTLSDLSTYVPEHADDGYQICGLVWFQGWNDMINDQYTAEYTDNMAHFIRDVRSDLKLPRLPVVIGQMGVDGDHANPKMQKFKDAEAAVADIAEFKDNVRIVATDKYWDTEADAVYKSGWKEHLDEWNKVGSEHPYHYLGSGKTMLGIGRAFAESILELQQ